MKITSKYTDIQLNQVNWMFFNLKQQFRCLYIVEKPVINVLPQKYIKFWYFNHFYQISQKALDGFWRNHAFFNPWKALFKTYYVSSFENCKKILTPSRVVCHLKLPKTVVISHPVHPFYLNVCGAPMTGPLIFMNHNTLMTY